MTARLAAFRHALAPSFWPIPALLVGFVAHIAARVDGGTVIGLMRRTLRRRSAGGGAATGGSGGVRASYSPA